jgi:bacterial/archaeal transporter family protein
MIHVAPWMIYTLLALVAFGVGGLLQKLSTDRVSAECAVVWLVVGFIVLEPLVYPGAVLGMYSSRSIAYVLLAGVLNAAGTWTVLAAMKNGGKASVVVPMTAVYPMVVCLIAPIFLHEPITALQGAGIACGLGAIFLLAS